MLILKLLWSRLYTRVDEFTARRHFGHFFSHHCIVYSFVGIFTPCKHAVVLAEHCGNCNIVLLQPLKFISDKNTSILLIRFLDFLFCEISYAGDFSVDIIRMCRSVAGMSLPACAQLVAHEECVCTTPPIFGKRL